MVRPLRIEFAGAVYHVTSRGDRREAIYEDTVPRAQRRPPAPSLEDIAPSHGEQKLAMVAAYATGAYSYRDIAVHVGVI